MLNERIDPNSIVGSGRVTRYLFAALSTSFIGAGLVRFAYTPLLPVLIESRWFDTSATVYLSAANPAGALFGAVTSTWLARRCSKVFILRGMNVLATPVVVSVRASDFIRVVFFLAISIRSRHGRHDRSCCGDVSSACSIATNDVHEYSFQCFWKIIDSK
jgi:hypothetical protein